jgi:hypothetical protein
MSNKQPANKSVAVRQETYELIKKIRKMPQMLAEGEMQRSYTDVVDEIANFYVKAHQKGKR